MTQPDHRVQTWDDNYRKSSDTMATAEEARAAEEKPFEPGSGVSITRVTPPQG
ncbi:hypothetical protein [Amycolatopsis sp. NPDC051903]|uniref:hypothetical protein n=1 Tax=Amycolatopsis sp. NPDC051903 TaxID=3363936 RepID=UPI0037BA4876